VSAKREIKSQADKTYNLQNKVTSLSPSIQSLFLHENHFELSAHNVFKAFLFFKAFQFLFAIPSQLRAKFI